MIRALLFDFDGTVVDTESIDLRSWQEVFEEHGVDLPLDRFALRIGTLSGPDELDELDALLTAPCDRDAVQAARRLREQELLEVEPIRPGIRRYLDDARRLGLAVAIVSSSGERWIADGLARLGCADVWACVVSANGVPERAKPAPTLYTEALQKLGVARDEAIAFEDSPNGILAARAAGIFCVAVPNEVTKRLDFSHADIVVESLEELPLERLLARFA